MFVHQVMESTSFQNHQVILFNMSEVLKHFYDDHLKKSILISYKPSVSNSRSSPTPGGTMADMELVWLLSPLCSAEKK